MLERKEQSFYLVEVDKETGKEYPMQKVYNGSAFSRTTSTFNAYKFDTSEKAKSACQLQNNMNEMFGETSIVYYAEENITRTLFNETGENIDNDTTESTSTQ
ncbi:hypothetical protein M4L90_02575 [Staphylococcus equorum]|uniref:Uncharacterized protein n=1 Tax=Staphylococcus equorum TaxID=246432 RepID=A0A9X4L140_9STAP|nr:hypothetical protein [Staphylococcus equorum]MDG0818773.1 hypothetical protein [Staphylococcus equorum]MDG0839414.1 hypothetical protein [Staphylococcus equorum]MDG0844860.1 hypothetical protein [Staphylococcus equorum]